MYQELKIALEEFMAAAAAHDPDKVSKSLRQIAELQAQLGTDSPPMLRHYLERRSYQKALIFLATGESESDRPAC